MSIEILTDLLQKLDLVALVDRYSPSPEAPAEVRYPLYAKQLTIQRFIMPVAGVQGSGKSTLLNALAFDRPVLPVDADETTCVPVEIAWSATPSGLAKVVLQNGQTEYIQATEEALKGYVHNEFNPGNEKGVDRIILESAEPIFESGLVLVDLPGTGSLTAANMETTRHYLDEAVGVLFMLRTVPPLTRSESVFVALQWARLPMAMFLQNRWTDETADEVENGREHNVSVLSDLATRNRIPHEGKPDVSVVNAYQAWHGRLSQNNSLTEQSGILTFSQRLGTLAQSWPMQLRRGITIVLTQELLQTQAVIELQLQQLSESREKVEADMADQHRRFDEYIGKLREKRAGAEKEADVFVSQQEAKLGEWVDKSRSELRNNMRTKMRAGIVDGPRLERALRDEESVVADDAFAEVEEAIMVFQDKMRERFKDAREWSATKNYEFESVSREEKNKWESLAPTVLGAGAGIGGGLGGMWAGAEIGLKLGLASGNPIGAIIGGVVGGILGGIIGCWTGNKTRETVIEQRAKAVEGDVFRAIDGFVAKLSESLLGQVQSFREHLLAALTAWEKLQVARFERERAKTTATMAASQEERAKMRKSLERDLAAVNEFQIILAGKDRNEQKN